MAGIAMSTAGIRLVYGDATVTGGTMTEPTTWTEIPDIKSFPDFSAAPATLETTTLAETKFKTYISGLQDLGGALEFNANLTNELIAAMNNATTEPAPGTRRVFGLEIPSPLKKRYWWAGTAQPVTPTGGEVDAVLETTVYVSMETTLMESAIV